MVVFSNQRLGPSAEIVVSERTASEVLRATAAAAKAAASARWEHELIRWLEDRSAAPATTGAIDVGDIAWTPDHFEAQRRFLTDAISAAAATSEESMILQRWAQMIAAHPRDSVRLSRLFSA